MNNKKNHMKKVAANNKTLKITYHEDTSENRSVYVYFTGSTLSELLDVVKKYDDGHRDAFDLCWFDDDKDKESKVIINHDDGVKIFMELTSRMKTRHLHVRPSETYDYNDYFHY